MGAHKSALRQVHMVGMVIFVAVCMGAVAFLVHVFICLCRETRPRRSFRKESPQSSLIAQLSPDPILKSVVIRPAGISEDMPFTVVTNLSRATTEFYVDEIEGEPGGHHNWQLFVNPKKGRAKKVM